MLKVSIWWWTFGQCCCCWCEVVETCILQTSSVFPWRIWLYETYQTGPPRVRVPMLASPAAARSEPGVDEVWCQIENIPSPGCDSQIFPNLTKAMKDIPVISHSNSDCENVFSLVTRTRLSTIPYEDTNAQQPYHNESLHGVTGKCLLQGGILRSGAAEGIPSQPHKPGWVHIMRGYVLDPDCL